MKLSCNLATNNSGITTESQEQGIYVPNVNAEVNRQIDKQLKEVAKTILESTRSLGFKLGIRSILIAGGFGKGEGSIKLTDTGRAICQRDFDLVVVADRRPSQKIADEIHAQIYKSLQIPNPTSCDFERGQNFAVDLMFLRRSDLIYPDIKFFDLKAASQVLWGEDIREVNPWTKKDVPISSGLRLLFEKVSGLLGTFSADYLESEEPTIEEKGFLLSECRKTFIEIGTSLCILAGKYEPKYSQRAQILPHFYRAKFPMLAQLLPKLPEKVLEYTNLRLNSSSIHVEEDPVDLWFLTKDYLLETLKFYLETYAGKSISNQKDFPKLVRTIAPEYYKPYLGPLINDRLHWSSALVLHLAAYLYQGLTNLEYSYVTASTGEGNPFKGMLSWHISPSLKYFTAGALLLSSLGRDGSVENVLLKTAQTELSKCVHSDLHSFDKRSWERLRIRYLKARKLYIGYHFLR